MGEQKKPRKWGREKEGALLTITTCFAATPLLYIAKMEAITATKTTEFKKHHNQQQQ
jgi:hypothetical protein